MTSGVAHNNTWPSAMATVLSCHYETGAGQALAIGVPTSKHFHITYNYWAPGPDGEPALHTGDFYSPKAVPQNTLFTVNYNPELPHEHTHDQASPAMNPLILVGILGSIILSAAWLLVMRGCH